MRKILISVIIFLFALACTNNEKKVEISPKKFDNGLWGYVDSEDNPLIFPKYTVAKQHNQAGFALVTDIRGDWYYITKNGGREVFQPYVIDNSVDEVQEGLYRFRQKGKVGFFHENGKVAIRAKFEYASRFKNGYALIAEDFVLKKNGEYTEISNGKWGYINKKGKIVVKPKYESASLFNKNGQAEVRLNGENFLINTKGEENFVK